MKTFNDWITEGKNDDKPLNKPMKGDVKKSKVYVKDPKTGNIKKVEFGDPNMSIKKDQPARKKSFRARHKCDQKKDKTTAGYWSCKAWEDTQVTEDDLEEAKLKQIAALALSLGIAFSGDGSYAADKKTDRFDKTYNSLTIKQKDRLRDMLDGLSENYADGKVKGKSRPGRVKKAGVDCKKSETELRKIAKNSSGEKQKMAHWCANMKGGKK